MLTLQEYNRRKYIHLSSIEAYEHVYDPTNHVQIRFQYENLAHVT